MLFRSGKVTEAAIETAVSPLKSKLEEVKAELAGLTDLESKDVPEVYKPMKVALEAQQAALESQIRIEAQLAEERASREHATQKDQETSVKSLQEQADEAIDGNPVLRYWRDKDAKMYDRAADLDALYRQDPDMQSLSFVERFGKVVAALEATHGKAELPPEYAPRVAASSDAATTAAPQAGAIVKPAAAAPRALTLSDLPGGAPPISNDAKLESMSNHEIGSHVNRLMDRGIMDPMALVKALDLPVSV